MVNGIFNSRKRTTKKNTNKKGNNKMTNKTVSAIKEMVKNAEGTNFTTYYYESGVNEFTVEYSFHGLTAGGFKTYFAEELNDLRVYKTEKTAHNAAIRLASALNGECEGRNWELEC